MFACDFSEWISKTEKAEPHISQNMVSIQCVYAHVYKFAFFVKSDGQNSQENSSSPVCVNIWVHKAELPEKAKLHNLRENGFCARDFSEQK